MHSDMTATPQDDLTKALFAAITDATSALASAEIVPDDIRDLIRGLPERLHADAPARGLAGDPYLAGSAIGGSALAAAALLDSDALVARRGVRLGLEQVRQALRDIIELRPIDEDTPIAEITAWLDQTLEGVSHKDLADLLGTTTRTWERWLTGTQPDADALIRLRRVAGLTMQLRHALTGPGVVRWFARPHPRLKGGGMRPIDLLDDPDGYQKLLALASGLRSTQAS
jgi:hypothetical protein